MPAHGGRNTIGLALKSNGEVITKVDWRANRLVDLLAKSAASPHRHEVKNRFKIEEAAAGIRFALCRLGSVTHAANNYKVLITHPDGEVSNTIKRDSAPENRRFSDSKNGEKRSNTVIETLRPTSSTSITEVGLLAQEKPPSKRQRLNDRETANDIKFWEHWVAGRGTLRAAEHGNAKARLLALRQRVSEREQVEVSYLFG